jgi:hypothetical protein
MTSNKQTENIQASKTPEDKQKNTTFGTACGQKAIKYWST